MASLYSFAPKQMKQRRTSSSSTRDFSIADQIRHGGPPANNVPETSSGIFARLVDSFDSPWVTNGFLVASGVIAGFLEFFTHLAVGHMNVPPAYHAFIDASVVALMTIALVGVCFASARTRRQVMMEKIRTASDLNHHLRNALQVITQSRYLPEEKQNQAVYSSIDRIDEALKRLSPR